MNDDDDDDVPAESGSFFNFFEQKSDPFDVSRVYLYPYLIAHIQK